MTTKPEFWDKMAAKYAAQPISNPDAYAQTLDRVAHYLTPETRVLELGCGTGTTALKLAPHAGEILATDYARGMIAQAEEKPGALNVRFMQADVHSAALQGQRFDVVLAFNLFHLVENAEADFARIHALLPPGGYFISKSPCLAERNLGWKFGLLKRMIPLMQWVGKAPYVRFDTIEALDQRIQNAGFEIVETGNYPVRPPNHFVVARRV